MMNSVLIVDDSIENVNSLRAILEGEYKVYVALSGEMALEVMQRFFPDIVLLDVIMPGMSGFDVFSVMKDDEKLKDIPVMFITGANDISDEQKGVKNGAVDYINKPYNPDIVYLKVKNHILNKTHRDNLEKLVEIRTQELTASRQAVIMGMSLLAERRDQGTGEHLQRMQQYTEVLARYVHEKYPDVLSKSEMESTILYSPLHDIGKVGSPDSILLKNGKLTDEEFDVIKNHTVFGSEVLKETDDILSTETDSQVLRVAIEICECHHEKCDGSGYPHAYKKDDIPISATIVALADVYDALTSARAYKAAFTHEEAYKIITEGDGRTMPEHFTPEVLDAFKNMHERFKELSLKFKY